MLNFIVHQSISNTKYFCTFAFWGAHMIEKRYLESIKCRVKRQMSQSWSTSATSRIQHTVICMVMSIKLTRVTL